jgi:hypothetical protein
MHAVRSAAAMGRGVLRIQTEQSALAFFRIMRHRRMCPARHENTGVKALARKACVSLADFPTPAAVESTLRVTQKTA